MNSPPTRPADSGSSHQKPKEREHPLFKLVIISSAAFLITVLSMIAVMLGTGESPLARFINRNGGRLLAVEVTLIIVFGFLAMAFDRQRTLKNQSARSRPADADTSGEGSASETTSAQNPPERP